MYTKLGCLEPNLTYTLRYALGDAAYKDLYRAVFESFDSDLAGMSIEDIYNQSNDYHPKEIASALFKKYELVQYVRDASVLMPKLTTELTQIYHDAVIEVANLVSPSFEAKNFPNENKHALRRYISDHLKPSKQGLVLQNDLFHVVFSGLHEFNPYMEPYYKETDDFLHQFNDVVADVYYVGGDGALQIARGQSFSILEVNENYKFLSFKWGNEHTLKNCYVLMVYITFLHRLSLKQKGV